MFLSINEKNVTYVSYITWFYQLLGKMLLKAKDVGKLIGIYISKSKKITYKSMD